MKRFSLFLSLITLFLAANAQVSSQYRGAYGTEEEQKAITNSLDSLDSHYSYKQIKSSVYDTLILNTRNFPPEEVPVYSADVIRQRLNEIPTVISMDYNKYVQQYIDMYTIQSRKQVSRMLGLTQIYFPTFEAELDKKNLPLELKYLTIVESALNPHAKSPKGATGLWQFMYNTGVEHGLKINTYVDERKDPLKSTSAAIDYLSSLYDKFGDWLLVIAAYNCGPGGVKKAIISSGGKQDFWSIRPYLPKETRGYVPAFIAATYSFTYAAEHNMYPIHVDFTLQQDTVNISRMEISLKEIANMTGTDYELLKNLNPELKLYRVPYSSTPYTLRVPYHVAEYFTLYRSHIHQKHGGKRKPAPMIAQAPVRATPSKYKSNARMAKPAEAGGSAGKSSKDVIYYTVKSGDVVGKIAAKYGVSSKDIAKWNSLKGYSIRKGQKLKIYPSGYEKASTSSSEKKEAASTTEPKYHKVKPGENLWEIARKYPSVSVDDIKKLNPKINPARIQVGQKLRVK